MMSTSPQPRNGAPSRPTFDLVTFGDFTIICASRKELVALALHDCTFRNTPTQLVFDANGHALSMARRDPEFAAMVKQADIIHADGGFLVTLSRLLKLNEIPERSATTDMLHDFADVFQHTPHGFFLLGSEERVNAECSKILQRKYPTLTISGRRNGFFSEQEEQEVVDEINASGADIVWVGLGKPKEQAFCLKWIHQLQARWIITCGGCFNYVTGDYPRAPMWMQNANLEWLHRLGTRPRALFARYLTTTPHALWIALTHNSNTKVDS